MFISHGGEFTKIIAMQLDFIISNPQQINGQSCIRGLGLTVRRVIELLTIYPDRAELRQKLPELKNKDIRQTLISALSRL